MPGTPGPAAPTLGTTRPGAAPPLLPTPLPRSGRAGGELVAGFPAAVRPVAGSTVTASSVSRDGSRVQVALDARTDRPPARVLRGLRLRLGRYGMAEEVTPAVAGTQAAAFRRGRSSVVVTLRPAGRGTAYSVHGVLHAGDG
ncbi:hypothetical protein [Nocardioides solisilvae]|uniref:hypothetical protein n=1 Tax=Nocardioides solisilvae TaxID=1542435 RepID=UPI000D74FC7C|nr:hypothetical protein [Nocardioides solisilvae]